MNGSSDALRDSPAQATAMTIPVKTSHHARGLGDAIELSIVTTLYRSERFLDAFYERMVAAAESTGMPFELIFVDDGSPDAAGRLAIELSKRDPRVVVVSLSRNFGHHKAMVAGLAESKGQFVFLIDSDLEESPEWLPDFLADLWRTEADVVYGVQERRVGSLLNKWLVGSFYTVFNMLSEVQIPANSCTVRIMRREFVNALLSLKDRNLYLGGNSAWAGFEQVGLPVVKSIREGRSTYTPGKMLALLLDAITSFTAYPLKLIFLVGLVIAATSGVIGSEMLVRKLLDPESIALGYSSIMVSLWFLGGLLILFVGVVGLYMSKIFAEVKERPQYIVRRIYRQESSGQFAPDVDRESNSLPGHTDSTQHCITVLSVGRRASD